MPNDTTRRDFMKITAGASAAIALSSMQGSQVFGEAVQAITPQTGTISMITLPYAENALEPFISATTVDHHYHKHHQGYYDLLKRYIDNNPTYQNATLDQLILKYKNSILVDETIFSLAVLLNNHNWYWQSLKPLTGGVPKGRIGKMVVESFGSYEGFKKAFMTEATMLGIGWVWIVQDGNKILAYRTDYRDTPLIKGYVPLLAIDVWEHAYYLDYQEDRAKYVDVVLTNLLNWEFAEKNLVPIKK